MRRSLPAALLLASGLAACGWPTVDVPRFCFTSDPKVMAAVPALPPGAPDPYPLDLPPITFQVPVELPPLLSSGRVVTLEVNLLDATLLSDTRDGHPEVDLSFVEAVGLDVEPGGGAPFPVASYLRPPTWVPPITAVVAQGDGTDIASLMGEKFLVVVLHGTVDATPPTVEWLAKVKICAHGRATARP